MPKKRKSSSPQSSIDRKFLKEAKSKTELNKRLKTLHDEIKELSQV